MAVTDGDRPQLDGKPANVGFRPIMANPSFRNLWIGQLVSQFGDGFYWLAIMLAVSALTGGNTAAIGLVSISFMLPQLPIGLLGGPLVDRVNRRQLMIVADVLRVITTLLCVGAYWMQTVWLFYALALLQASISGFFFPAKNALIPQIVKRDELMSANTLSQSTQIGALIFGPALAGFTIEHLGIESAFVIDAVTFAVSALFLWLMASVPTLGEGRGDLRRTWQELREGLSFAVHSPVIRSVTLILGVLMLGIGAINVLWVPLLQTVFGLGAQAIGMVDAFQGVGMLLGTLLMGTAILRRQTHRSTLLGGLLLVSLVFVAIGLAPNYAFILGVSLILGVGIPPAQASFMTMVQEVTPDEMMGRVGGASGVVTNSAMLLSMALAAGLGDWIGLRQVYVACGLLGVLSVVIGLAILPDTSAAASIAAPIPAPSGERRPTPEPSSLVGERGLPSVE